ncbi:MULTISPECIES: hypothetical protein [Halomonadaceae]|uniref:hypothetical protein n=1 Tax=Halomonadaceae TaxID=28256 RepID=UPI001598D32A|nr:MULTISPECIES: hypothetical protein [Halomonas]QJQ95742.1 hypothetical protein HIO72_11000 [Halomonas sp. PA5]
MTETLIWLIAFALILFFCLKAWEGTLREFLVKILPEVLRPGHGDRWIWCPAFAVLGATFLIRPIDMILSLLTLALVYLIIRLVLGAAMKRF